MVEGWRYDVCYDFDKISLLTFPAFQDPADLAGSKQRDFVAKKVTAAREVQHDLEPLEIIQECLARASDCRKKVTLAWKVLLDLRP